MAIENKNNPESIVNTPEFNPPRNWKNWSSVHTWSGSSGPVFPVKHWDLPKDATCKIDLKTLIKSFPSANPLLAHFKMRYSLFFCPYRLYVPNLNNDNVNELSDIEQIEFPAFGATSYSSSLCRASGVPTVRPGSLLHYLGYAPRASFNEIFYTEAPGVQARLSGSSFAAQGPGGPGQMVYLNIDTTDKNQDEVVLYLKSQGVIFPNHPESETDQEITHYMLDDNAIPWLAYVDIYTHYIANPNENFVPYRIYYTADGHYRDYDIKYIPLQALQAIVPYISERGASAGYIEDTQWYLTGANIPAHNEPNARYINNLMIHYGEDSIPLFEQVIPFADTGNLFTFGYAHQGMFYSTYLPDYFTTWVDPDDYQLVNSLSLPNMNIQQIRLAERKWVDYARQLAKHSKRYSDWLEQKYGGPRLKMDTKPIFVGSDTLSIYFEDVTSTAETDPGTYAGSLGAQTSKVDFVQPDGMSKPISFTTQEPGLLMCVAQIVPEVSYGQGIDRFLKKRRMADLYTPLYDAVGFQSIYASEVDARTPNPMQTLGDVPGWYEYMSKVNTHTGLLSLPEFRSWVLERDFHNFEQGFSSVPNLSTYIDASMYDANFVNIGQYEDNFIIQTLFDFKVKLPMSNQIINTRW